MQIRLVRLEYARAKGYIACLQDDEAREQVYTFESSLALFGSVEAAAEYFADAHILPLSEQEPLTVNSCLLELAACHTNVSHAYRNLFLDVYSIVDNAASQLHIGYAPEHEVEALTLLYEYDQFEVTPERLDHLFAVVKSINQRLMVLLEEYVLIGLDEGG